MIIHVPKILPLHVLSIGSFNNLPDMARFDDAGGVYTLAAWPTNNLALYFPVHLPAAFTVARFLVANGTNTTGNVDVGLYDFQGNRLLSTGTTARSGASAVQYVGVTDTAFPAGHYYLALVGSSTTGTYGCLSVTVGNAAAEARMCGALQEALGSTVLPATMTPAAYTSANWYYFGFTQSDSL